MPDENPSEDDVRAAFRRQIALALNNTSHPPYLLQLAEAWAWVERPNQPHGGSVSVGK